MRFLFWLFALPGTMFVVMAIAMFLDPTADVDSRAGMSCIAIFTCMPAAIFDYQLRVRRNAFHRAVGAFCATHEQFTAKDAAQELSISEFVATGAVEALIAAGSVAAVYHARTHSFVAKSRVADLDRAWKCPTCGAAVPPPAHLAEIGVCPYCTGEKRP